MLVSVNSTIPMKLSDHSLRQLDTAYPNGLGEEALRHLSVKLLEDLKEAREWLNQNSNNSSRPPSSQAPWEKSEETPHPHFSVKTAKQDTEKTDSDNDDSPSENSNKSSTSKQSKNKKTPQSAGKVKGSQGCGRKAPERVNAIKYHTPSTCLGCNRSLLLNQSASYTGHYEVDWIRNERGDWQIHYIKHLWQETLCECGHLTRSEPERRLDEGVEISEIRLIGAGMASLIVALFLRYWQSRSRIREFIGEWLGVLFSVGAIYNVIEEAGLAVVPMKAELITAIQESELLHTR